MADEGRIATVIEALHSGPRGHRGLVRDLVAETPEAPAATIVAALTEAANAIAANFTRDGHAPHEANLARKLADRVVADIEILRARGSDAPTCADLQTYWDAESDFFLRL